MSRIGRMPIAIPAGVTVKLGEENLVTVKGPKGELTKKLHPLMTITEEAGVLHVTRPNEEKKTKALHGLTRALLHNMVVGVSEGYSKQLDIVGVGYRAVKQGNVLQLYLGHSLLNGQPQAKYCMKEPAGITFEVPNPNTIIVKGADKQQVGQIAAQIREKRPPEPYLGKGVKYTDEVIRRKAGKTGK